MKSSSRQSRSLLLSTLSLLLLITGVLWFFFYRDGSQSSKQSSDLSEALPNNPSVSITPGAGETPISGSLPAEGTLFSETSGSKEDPSASAPLPTLPTKEQLPLAVERINSFYLSLDQQKYIQEHHIDGPSSAYFTRITQNLLNKPPVVIRETDDILTVLQNSAHFFRILGKDNILIIKEILSHEQDKIEDIMADYFLLAEQPDSLSKDLSLKIPQDALYKYACFFLNTMGGRSYLSRRTSRVRMISTYYSILIVDQANQNEKNLYGIELQPAINLLTSEIETGGNHLRYKEAYLDTLYDLKEKYQ